VTGVRGAGIGAVLGAAAGISLSLLAVVLAVMFFGLSVATVCHRGRRRDARGR
jgi:hypothetical protein